MNAPQILAILLLAYEVITAFILGKQTKTRTGNDLMLDAALWTLILIWGGFWT